MTVCDLRCGLPELVAGKSDMKMKDVKLMYFSTDLVTDDRENLRNHTYCGLTYCRPNLRNQITKICPGARLCDFISGTAKVSAHPPHPGWATTAAATTTATTEEFSQSIQVPFYTHPGTTHPVRANPSLRPPRCILECCLILYSKAQKIQQPLRG